MAIWLKRRRRGGQAHTDVQALQHAVTELEKERDFYYGKLRSVELLCQNAEEDTQGARRRRHPPTSALFLRAAQYTRNAAAGTNLLPWLCLPPTDPFALAAQTQCRRVWSEYAEKSWGSCMTMLSEVPPPKHAARSCVCDSMRARSRARRGRRHPAP